MSQKKPWYLTSLFLLCALTSLPARSHERSQIIGDNDLVRATRSKFPKKVVESIGVLQVGCTVTHLGKGVALTAGHCFSDTYTDLVRNRPCNSADYNVRWGVNYEGSKGSTSQCKRIIATEYNDDLDYAIFLVSPEPETSLDVSLNELENKDLISIFSHPEGRPLEWSQYCDFEYGNSFNQILYECDTQGGSSGAAILNEKLEVVGTHNFYNDRLVKNGGTLLRNIPYFKQQKKSKKK